MMMIRRGSAASDAAFATVTLLALLIEATTVPDVGSVISKSLP